MLSVHSNAKSGPEYASSAWRRIEYLIELELDSGCNVTSKPDPETGGVVLIFSSSQKTLSVLLSKQASDRFSTMAVDQAANLLSYLAHDLSVCEDE